MDMQSTKATRKPQKELKDAAILIRLTEEQKATLGEAAKKAGLDLSSWLRSLGLREALKKAA